jgi:hypothetical protein
VGGSVTALFVLLGLVVAWWRDGREGRIRSSTEIEEGLSVEVLGAVNDIELSHVEARRRSQQQYRFVVHTALARLGDSGGALLVAGVGANSMAEEVAATLGAELVRTGRDVRLIYSDDQAAQVFAHSLGTELGTDRRQLESISLGDARLDVDGGAHTPDLSHYVEHSAHHGRQVVFATPPTRMSADAQALAPYATFTLLVVSLNESTKSDVAEALRQLRQVGVVNVGVIVVAKMSRRERSLSKARLSERRRWLETRGSGSLGAAAPAEPVAAVPDDHVAELGDAVGEVPLSASPAEESHVDEAELTEAARDGSDDSEESDELADLDQLAELDDSVLVPSTRAARKGQAGSADEHDDESSRLAPVPVKRSR